MKITLQGLFSAILTVLMVSGLLATNSATAQTPPVVKKVYEIDLSWTPNTEADLAGYHVFRGSGALVCNDMLTPLPPLVNQATQTQATPGKADSAYHDGAVPQQDGQICYEITAFDEVGNESDRSNRVAATLNANPPSAPRSLGLNLKVVIK